MKDNCMILKTWLQSLLKKTPSSETSAKAENKLLTTEPSKPEEFSKYFTRHDAIYLPSWGREATSEDGLTPEIEESLKWFARNIMDPIREELGVECKVHCWYRPPAYNKQCRGAPGSAHQAKVKNVCAVDFDPKYKGLTQAAACKKARAIIIPMLEKLGARLENNGDDAGWLHVDSAPVVYARYFSI